MDIRLSRHAKRRAKLYTISDTVIANILKNTELSPGKHAIVKKVQGFIYPLKVVVSVESSIITVITIYPLKKGL